MVEKLGQVERPAALPQPAKGADGLHCSGKPNDPPGKPVGLDTLFEALGEKKGSNKRAQASNQ